VVRNSSQVWSIVWLKSIFPKNTATWCCFATNWVLETECGTAETLSFIAGYIKSVSGRVQAVQWELLLESLNGDRIEVMSLVFF
jgi:hypothetical protein